jgi:putative membrane protein
MLAAMAMALASAQLGTRSAADEGVKLFAQLELEEQMAFAEARRLAGLSAPAPNMLTAQQQQSLGALRAQSGAAFDRMFVSVQTEGHQELLRLNRGTAERPPGREEAMLATVAIPAIRSHLTMLAGMQRALPAPS